MFSCKLSCLIFIIQQYKRDSLIVVLQKTTRNILYAPFRLFQRKGEDESLTLPETNTLKGYERSICVSFCSLKKPTPINETFNSNIELFDKTNTKM